jgi:hypothetical protein
MLTLAVVDANVTGANVVTWFGIFILAIVAAVVVGVWLAVARELARRSAGHRDDDADDPGLEALRHRHLLVRRARNRQPTDVVELVPDSPNPGAASPRDVSS